MEVEQVYLQPVVKHVLERSTTVRNANDRYRMIKVLNKASSSDRFRKQCLLAAAAGTLMFSGFTEAASITWAVSGGGDYNTAANWDPSTAVPGSGDTAIFNNNSTGNVTFTASTSVGSLNMQNTSGALTFDLSGTTYTAGKITLGTAAGQVNDLTISNGTLLQSTTTVLYLLGFNGSHGNTLTFSGSNTKVISTATSTGNSVGVAGSNNNKLIVKSGANYAVSNNILVGVIGATPSTGNSIDILDSTFAITNGNRGITLNQGTLTITNSYADLGGPFTANTAGNTAWINFNSGSFYARGTKIANGQPFIVGDGGATAAVYGMSYSTPTATFANGLQINSNGKVIGSGTITGDISGVAGAKAAPSIVGNPGLTTDDRNTGTLAVTGNWDNRNIELTLDLGDLSQSPVDPPTDHLNVTGTFTQGGSIKFDLASYLPPQDVDRDVRLVSWTTSAGLFADTSVSFVNGSPLTYDFRTDGLYVTAVAVAANSFWNVDADGNWGTSANWSPTVSPNAVGGTANFGTIITSTHTVTVNAAKTVGTINFDNVNSYVIAGTEILTLDVASGSAGINVLAGSHTISAPVVLNDDIIITSAASTGVALTGAVTATGKAITKAGAGTAQFENVQAAALAVNEGQLKISSKGTANDPTGTSVVTALSIATGASLDLTNNSAIVDYAAVGTLVDDTRQMLAAGKLTTSSLGGKLGYADNAVLHLTSFAGQTVDDTNLLVKFTYGGDANLDGQVDISDLGALATAWQTSNVWTGGDFDYSGFVDISDLGILATNWQLGVGSPLGPSFDEALAAVGLSGVTVPEPSAIVALAALTGFRRRRANR